MADIIIVGTEKKGDWQIISKESPGNLLPNRIYEFDYKIPEAAWWEFWKWGKSLDVAKFASDLRTSMATAMQIPESRVIIDWIYHNEETREVKIQLHWLGDEVAAVPSLAISPSIILGIGIIITLIYGIFTANRIIGMGSDRLEQLKVLVKETGVVATDWMKQFKYIIIGGGIIAVVGLLIWKWPKKT